MKVTTRRLDETNSWDVMRFKKRQASSIVVSQGRLYHLTFYLQAPTPSPFMAAKAKITQSLLCFSVIYSVSSTGAGKCLLVGNTSSTISENRLPGHWCTWATQRWSSYATTAPKKGTFTMWEEHIVLFTRGSSNYAHIAFEQVIEDTIQTEEHTVKKYV